MEWLVPVDIGIVQGLIFSSAVLAFALAFRLFNFPDLSIEGSFPLGAAVFAGLVRNDVPLGAAIVAVIASGAVVGAGTALMHVKLGINKFLAGVLMAAICYSMSFRAMAAPNLGLLDTPSIFTGVEAFDLQFDLFHWGTLLLLTGMTAAIALALFAFFGSRLGLRVRVAGTNPDYARTLGISVPAMMVLGLAVTNALAAWSGAVLAMHQGFADVSMGLGLIVFAIAGVMIGERILPRNMPYFVFVIVASLIGSMVYQMTVAFALRVDIQPTDLKLVAALFVLVVIAAGKLRGKEGLSEL